MKKIVFIFFTVLCITQPAQTKQSIGALTNNNGKQIELEVLVIEEAKGQELASLSKTQNSIIDILKFVISSEACSLISHPFFTTTDKQKVSLFISGNSNEQYLELEIMPDLKEKNLIGLDVNVGFLEQISQNTTEQSKTTVCKNLITSNKKIAIVEGINHGRNITVFICPTL